MVEIREETNMDLILNATQIYVSIFLLYFIVIKIYTKKQTLVRGGFGCLESSLPPSQTLWRRPCQKAFISYLPKPTTTNLSETHKKENQFGNVNSPLKPTTMAFSPLAVTPSKAWNTTFRDITTRGALLSGRHFTQRPGGTAPGYMSRRRLVQSRGHYTDCR